jgi:hypothetical protein
MREITLVLVLANLAFLAWGLWIAPGEPAQRVAPPEREHLDRLVLASEAERTQPTKADRSADDAPVRAPADPSVTAPSTDKGGATGTDQTSALVDHATSPLGTPAQEAGTSPVTTDAAADGTAQTVAMMAPARGPRCVSVGPFLDLAETAEAAARLHEQGYAPRQRLAESPVWVGHWVYLAPLPTRADAVVAVEKLRARGVQDLYIEAAGTDENAVSLGLFGTRDRAETLASEIRNLGFAPQIGDKFRLASVYWVDVVLPPDAGLKPAEYQTRPGRIVREEEHACPEGTVAPIFVNSEEQQ